ncbi:hypothetical protein C463_04881 [Halorubrum californiense DSM 19288]|uniref:YgjP-like metallopeptidase domain-containing protein n=2 Tax=Halorubrum californiense TaxID=416585 RepID=M0EED8_9EURY|nr:SprT family zinc-dependent metalloprotease [Halorubrum sp. GN11GM_10-3_MGM]ELZ46095.1 hypothetical protein C463_04881 [Halorubrum californiense DSM 19288]
MIDLLGDSVEFEVRRSSAASKPRIDVDIHGVTVVIPQNEDIQPSKILRENAAWVVDKQRSYEAYREQIPDRTFEVGESFPLLGKDRELVIESRTKNGVDEDTIRLRESAVKQSSVKQVLENFYRRQARDFFTNRIEQYAERMDVEYDKIEVRNQRTKWGSCSTTGTLGLNWRLLMAPPDVAEYVVIHELAHLREQNHTDEFWSYVEEYDSSYKEHNRWLKENSVQLIFTPDDL